MLIDDPEERRVAQVASSGPGRSLTTILDSLRRPSAGKIAIKVINHYGDEIVNVMTL